MIQRANNLSANIVAFCRYLRQHNFFIGPNEERDSLQALEILQPYQEPERFQLCLQTTLCKTPAQLKKFSKLYQQYWKELERAVDSKIEEQEEESKKKAQSVSKAPGLQAIKQWLYGNKNTDTTETAAYSNFDSIGLQSYPEFDERELSEIFQLVKKLIRKIANRRSRRFSSTHKKAQIDLKKTMRKNILRNGELIEIMYRAKKKNQIKVVLLCDVSKSMELYSRFFIQFMYAFQNSFPKIQTFVFSTQLNRITSELDQSTIDQSISTILNKVPTWGGGTKIGSALQTFNEKFAHKYLDHKSLVLILSDGWDTGEADLMASAMKQLHRKALKVLWLNPLAGSQDWQPEVIGMKAALPYIDALIPFHSTESLRKINWRF